MATPISAVSVEVNFITPVDAKLPFFIVGIGIGETTGWTIFGEHVCYTQAEVDACIEKQKPRVEAAWRALTSQQPAFTEGQSVWVVSYDPEARQLGVFEARYLRQLTEDDGYRTTDGHWVEDDELGEWWERSSRIHATREAADAALTGGEDNL